MQERKSRMEATVVTYSEEKKERNCEGDGERLNGMMGNKGMGSRVHWWS